MNSFSLLLAATALSGRAGPAQASEADEGPEPYRLRGDDEGGWMIDGDPLLRVWDTAADAIAEVPGDWWEEESGCWMATAIEPSADNARKLAVTPPKKEHPLSGVRTEAALKGPGKKTRAQRRANNARKIANAERGSKELPASPINPQNLSTFKAVKPMSSDTRCSLFYVNGFMGCGSYALRGIIHAVESAGHKLTGLYSSIGNENAVFKVFRGLGVASISSNPHDFTVSLHHPMMGKRYEVHVCDTAEQILAVLKTVDDHVGWRPSKAGRQ